VLNTIQVPAGGFKTILADPPWRFRTWSETNQKKSASRYYALMTTEEIQALPVGEVAAPNCTLFLWVIQPMLQQALDVLTGWGFTYKTVAFVWSKPGIGLGYWTRSSTEQCWLATRGHPKRRATATGVRQLIEAPTREHSRKPDEQYPRIEELVEGPYLELFARTSYPGWTAWGDESGKWEVQADL